MVTESRVKAMFNSSLVVWNIIKEEWLSHGQNFHGEWYERNIMAEKKEYKIGTRYDLGNKSLKSMYGTYAGKSDDGRYLFVDVDDDRFFTRNDDGFVDFYVDWIWQEVTE